MSELARPCVVARAGESRMRGARYNVLMERGWNDDSHLPIKETSYDDLILMRKEFVCIFSFGIFPCSCTGTRRSGVWLPPWSNRRLEFLVCDSAWGYG